MKKALFFALCLLGAAPGLLAQDDLLGMMGDDSTATTFTQATFKSTRVINGHSVETLPRNHLDFRISHRFGRLNSGPYELWGLDAATIRIGLEYGITNRLMVGVGRSSNQKLYDAFAKFKLLRQSSGARPTPVTVTVLASAAANTLRFPPEEAITFQSRLSYCGQLLVARKLSERLSLQLMPTLLYRNRTNFAGESNLVAAVGAAGRFKISKRVALNGEYYAVLPDQLNRVYHNSLAVGFDIETGGHVFALHFTNSLGMVEKQFLAETEGQWGQGDIHYGFNISRTFSLNRKTKK
ncbi:MAG TPA: DUF5777 family beta-barrel protein [Cytophagales bacterium]|jgi:hypothetical protein